MASFLMYGTNSLFYFIVIEWVAARTREAARLEINQLLILPLQHLIHLVLNLAQIVSDQCLPV